MTLERTKITLKEFVKKLNELFGDNSYTVENCPEVEDGEIVTLKLIYAKKGGKHIASWQSGYGWIF